MTFLGVVLLFTALNYAWSQDGPIQIRKTQPATVLKDILEGLDKHVLPGQSYDGSTTQVAVSLAIESLSSFSAATMVPDYTIDMDVETVWRDHRLCHNFTDPVLLTSNDMELVQNLWQPDFYFVNEKQVGFRSLVSPSFAAFIFPDGLVFELARQTLTLSCTMDLTMFPLDDQECPIKIQSYSYMESLVTLSWQPRYNGYPINIDTVKLTDMFITNITYEASSYVYSVLHGEANWSSLEATIHTRRYITYHLLQTYLPSTLLVIISWISFWLPMSAIPARVSLSITTLLTLVNVSNGARQGLPAVSYIKAVDEWLNMCVVFIFVSLVEYTVVISLDNREKNPSSKWACSKKCYKLASRVDMVARVLFPITFLVYAISYWARGLVHYFT